MTGIIGHAFICPGCGLKEWSPADKMFHACPQYDGQEAEMAQGRKSTRQPPKDGKCRTATLELIAQGPVRPLGVLVECACPVRYFVSPASVRRKCFICRTWRRRV